MVTIIISGHDDGTYTLTADDPITILAKKPLREVLVALVRLDGDKKKSSQRK